MKLYHGSDLKVSVLKPLGVNMGLRFQTPQWATYFWNDYTLALKWAVFQHIRRRKLCKVLYEVPTGNFIVKQEDVSSLKRAIGQLVYVYETEQSFGKYGYGSSPDIEEYTVAGDVVPDKTHSVKVTKELLGTCMTVMDTGQIQTYVQRLRQGEFKPRNVFLSMLMDREKDIQRHKYHQLITAGVLQPGDDLSKVKLDELPKSSIW